MHAGGDPRSTHVPLFLFLVVLLSEIRASRLHTSKGSVLQTIVYTFATLPPSAHSTAVLLVCAFVHGAQAAIRLYLPSTLYR